MTVTEEQWNKTFNVLQLNTSIDVLKQSCLECSNVLKNNSSYPIDNVVGTLTTTETLKRGKSYNIFAFPFLGFYELFIEIRNWVWMSEHTRLYAQQPYIRGWLNVAQEGEFVDWHHHSGISKAGFVGVVYIDNTKDSGTQYIYKQNNGVSFVKDVAPGDGYMVIYREVDGMFHRTQPVLTKEPRITIAFSISARQNISSDDRLKNYWIPLC